MEQALLPTPREVLRRVRRRGQDAVEWISGVRHGVYGLAVLRIGYGLVLLGLLLTNYGDRRLLWGPESPWTADLLGESLVEDGTFSLFAISESGLLFEILYHAFIVLVVLFIAGWRTRWVTPLLAVMLWSWHQRQPWILDGGDNLMQLVLIYLSFADLSARWSLDARRAHRGERPPAVSPTGKLRWRLATVLHNSALLAALLQVSILYMNAGLLKVRGEIWQEGTALYYTLRVEEFQPFPWLSHLIYDNALLVTTGSYAAVFIQLAFPLLMLNRVTRRLGLVAVTGMHTGIGLLMGLSSFSLIMIATDLLFVRDATYMRFAGFVRVVDDRLGVGRRLLRWRDGALRNPAKPRILERQGAGR
ncbi:HTTM domain-containing protein [Streptosporangium canum]|uniref:HTTM domain-containing protein n=1 Tax=Streptosporangium canum TaxID=324952 RepID=UPI0036A6B212